MSKETIKQYFLLCSIKSSPKLHILSAATIESNIPKKNIRMLFTVKDGHVIVNEHVIGGNEEKILII